jgi:hypothetical protein
VIARLVIAIVLIPAVSGLATPSAEAADAKGPKTLFESIFGSRGRLDGPEEEDRIDPDRPHFPEASTAVGGLVYFITKNVAIDIRAGWGLNRPANDVIAGTGFAVRY